MDEYKLDINNEAITVKGDISSLKKNRFLYKYLCKRAIRMSETIVELDYDDKKEELTRIHMIFKKNKINLVDEESTDNEFNLIKMEEMKFQEFSEKARNIRNNNCNIDDFKEFAQSVQSRIVSRTLYDKQLLSAYHMAFSQNSCNFSVPGSGKTSIVYGAFTYLNNLDTDHHKYIDKILVVGPLASFYPWENEYFECFLEKPASQRISSSEGINKNYFFSTDNESNLVLISYQGLISCKDSIINYLKRNRVMLVLDEAHKIKNTDDGIIAKTALDIAQYAKARIVLTGTPIPNGYEDLYNIYKFIWPTKNIIGFHSYQLRELTKNPEKALVEKLVNNIEPFFIRIRKKDMDNLPSPIEVEPIYVKMDSVQERLYTTIESRIVEEYTNSDSNNFINSMKKAKLIRLMQVASNVNLLNKPIEENLFDSETATLKLDRELLSLVDSYDMIPPKFNATMRLCTEVIASGEKIIIWCTYIDNILSLSEYLSINGIYNKILYGAIPTESSVIDVSEETRESIIKEFHSNPRLSVLVANPHSVGESISLHKACHNALYFEKNFNATQFLQSRDRIHRFGLKETDEIRYYYLLTLDTIDVIIHDKLFIKKARMEEVIDKNDIPLFDNLQDDIGDEDIKGIIRQYVKRNRI